MNFYFSIQLQQSDFCQAARMEDLRDKVAIVTGSTSGLGR